MPTYTPQTRQLRIHRSTHEVVRAIAADNHERIGDTYRRLAAAAATTETKAALDPLVRVTIDIDDGVWEALQIRGRASARSRAGIIEWIVANSTLPSEAP